MLLSPRKSLTIYENLKKKLSFCLRLSYLTGNLSLIIQLISWGRALTIGWPLFLLSKVTHRSEVMLNSGKQLSAHYSVYHSTVFSHVILGKPFTYICFEYNNQGAFFLFYLCKLYFCLKFFSFAIICFMMTFDRVSSLLSRIRCTLCCGNQNTVVRVMILRFLSSLYEDFSCDLQ